MRHFPLLAIVAMIVALAPGVLAPASAHQPFCEEGDLGPEAPWKVVDPSISVAFYGTLLPAGDVDYFTFDGRAGQMVLLGITIPQIAGQETFAPTLAVMGPTRWASILPEEVVRAEGEGALVMAPPPGPPPTFFEPFTRTSYWERQERRVRLPADGRYTIAVWHADARVGRYVLVIGEREVLGGDIGCLLSMREYWTPVAETALPQGHAGEHPH